MSTTDRPTLPAPLVRAAAGAEFLDRLDPAWFVMVDAATLDIGSGHLCVLGQLARYLPCSWGAERHTLYLRAAEHLGLDVLARIDFGFVPTSLDDVVPLTQAWLIVLYRRRMAGPAAVGEQLVGV